MAAGLGGIYAHSHLIGQSGPAEELRNLANVALPHPGLDCFRDQLPARIGLVHPRSRLLRQVVDELQVLSNQIQAESDRNLAGRRKAARLYFTYGAPTAPASKTSYTVSRSSPAVSASTSASLTATFSEWTRVHDELHGGTGSDVAEMEDRLENASSTGRARSSAT